MVFLNINILHKGVPFSKFQVYPFLASLEQKRNTFRANWNVEYNQITYHLLQIKIY